jgi:hypothetical protein
MMCACDDKLTCRSLLNLHVVARSVVFIGWAFLMSGKLRPKPQPCQKLGVWEEHGTISPLKCAVLLHSTGIAETAYEDC